VNELERVADCCRVLDVRVPALVLIGGRLSGSEMSPIWASPAQAPTTLLARSPRSVAES
jgi:hypothetical protein